MLTSKSLIHSDHICIALPNLEFSFKKFILKHTNHFIWKSRLFIQTLLQSFDQHILRVRDVLINLLITTENFHFSLVLVCPFFTMNLHFVLLNVLIPLDLTDVKLSLQIIHRSNLVELHLLDFFYSSVFCILYWLRSNGFCGQNHLHEIGFKVKLAKLIIRVYVI